ncbi:hypothetical protein N0V90_001081 [Kalmusia sp. IMI 367209]|nr:hypothetical protein N0V90_001081 [Kalmusia sp. IMI 367209]
MQDGGVQDNTEFLQKGISDGFALAKAAYTTLIVPDGAAVDPRVEEVMTWLFAEHPGAELVEIKYELINRFKKRAGDDGRFYDPDADSVVVIPSGGLFDPPKECKTPLTLNPNEGIMDSVTFAFTLTGGKWSTITFCPWFLDYVNRKGLFKSYNIATWAVGKWLRAQKMMENIAEQHFTPIDLVAMFDKMVLHELMHSIDNLGKTDVEGYKGYDSLALFGSAVKLINDGFRIGKDGKVMSSGDRGAKSDIWLPADGAIWNASDAKDALAGGAWIIPESREPGRVK